MSLLISVPSHSTPHISLQASPLFRSSSEVDSWDNNYSANIGSGFAYEVLWSAPSLSLNLRLKLRSVCSSLDYNLNPDVLVIWKRYSERQWQCWWKTFQEKTKRLTPLPTLACHLTPCFVWSSLSSKFAQASNQSDTLKAAFGNNKSTKDHQLHSFFLIQR